MKSNAFEEAEQKLIEYINANGLRHTEERIHILKEICNAHGTVTPTWIESQLKTTHPISRATIYNTLQLLVKANIIFPSGRKLESRQQEYELVTKKQNQIQIVCTSCGRVTYTRDKAIDSIINNKKFSNFVPRNYTMCIYGECKHCKRKEKK